MCRTNNIELVTQMAMPSKFDAPLAEGSHDHPVRCFRPSMLPQPKNAHFFHDTQSRRVMFLAGADMKETSP
jgi:hypothetical protein